MPENNPASTIDGVFPLSITPKTGFRSSKNVVYPDKAAPLSNTKAIQISNEIKMLSFIQKYTNEATR